MSRMLILSLMFATACSTNDGTPPPPDAPGTPDAAVGSDAPAGAATTQVDCYLANTVADVRYDGDALAPPSTTIARGEAVRFHTLGSHTAWHDQGLFSANGDTELCVQFSSAGTYEFSCYFHPGNPDEHGTITVE